MSETSTEKIKTRKLKTNDPDIERQKTIERIDELNNQAFDVGIDNIDKAREFSVEAYKLSKAIKYEKGIAYGILLSGYYDYFNSRYDKAFDCAKNALKMFKKINHEEGIADTLQGYGSIHWSMGNYDAALKYSHEGLSIYEKLDSRSKMAWAQTSLGAIYENVGDSDKALFYHSMSLEHFKQMEDVTGIGRALTGIGTVYYGRGEFSKSLDNHMESLKLYRETGHKTGESRALNDIGMVYQSLGKLNEALKHHLEALKIRRELGNRSAEITSLINLGRSYNQKHDSKKAIDYLKQGLSIAEELRARPKIYQCHEALSVAHEREKDYEKSLYHHKRYLSIKQDVSGHEAENRLKNFQIELEIEKSEREAEIHRLKNVKLAETLEVLKNAQAKLIQSERLAALGGLVAGIAHEFNTPVGAIKSGIDTANRAIERMEVVLSHGEDLFDAPSLRRIKRSLKNIRAQNDSAEEAAARIRNIIHSLVRFARLDSADLQLNNIHEGLDSAVSIIVPQLPDRIEIIKKYGKVPRIYCYPLELNQVFMTLLLNSADAIAGKGYIEVETSFYQNQVSIKIADSGKGIDKSEFDKIFDVRVSQDQSELKFHVGLANAYDIVRKHHGSIEVESIPGEKTSFKIILPAHSPLRRMVAK